MWDPYQKVHQDSLEKVQRRAVRFVKNDYRHTSSVSNMLKDLKWDTLHDRRQRARLITIYKETHNLIPSNISHLLARNNATSARPATRQSHELNYKQIRPNKDCYKYSLHPRTIPQWNKLPPAVKSAPNLDSFKRLLENGEPIANN